MRPFRRPPVPLLMCKAHLKVIGDHFVALICSLERSIVPTLVHGFLGSPAYEPNSRVSLLFPFLQITRLLCKGSLPLSTDTYRRGKQAPERSNISCTAISAALRSKWPNMINSLVFTFTSFIITSCCATRADAMRVSKEVLL